MAISNTTRTHLVYQFIILTLLFLSIGYNELLPDRKFLLFLVFIPIFCYQLVILSCCMELMPVPLWMSFLKSPSKKYDSKLKELDCDSPTTSLASTTSGVHNKKKLAFPDVSEISCHRRWKKSVTNLGASPKYLTPQQKAKSWMSLNDSRSAERLLSREGSLDVLAPLSNKKCSSRGTNKTDKVRNREERAKKAKSWKPCETNFDIPPKELVKSSSLSAESTETPLPSATADPQESELSKSYSFPFRQKRLETWLEMKETSMQQSNQSLDMPYWQSVGYNLAVKYEARRRRRATSNTTKSDLPYDEPIHTMQKHPEMTSDSSHTDKQNSKKCAKSASACINKIKVGFSNLISKKKDEVSESTHCNTYKVAKSNILQKLITKNTCPTKDKEKVGVNIPEFPQFLSNDRPLLFYPKYLPFEKERFESDVRKKIKELADEQKSNCST